MMLDKKETIQRWWDFPAAILLLSALVTAASRLVATRWTENLSIVQTLVFFGVLAGFALGKSIFSPQTAFSIGFVYGVYAISWQIGMTLNHTLPWLDRINILNNRLAIILQQLVLREPIQDSLLFVVVMAIVFWTLAIHAGYTLVRYGNAWSSILPTGIAIFIIHAFDPLVTRRSWYLAIYIFFCLVLLARMVFIQRQEQWKTSRTALPPHLGVDFIRFSIAATLVVVLVSWTIPALANTVPVAQKAWQPVQRLWKDAEDQFDHIFASLKATVGIVSKYYGVSTSLGRGIPLTDNHIFNVRAPNDLPINLRLYWRARSYDTYINGQWFSTNISTFNYDPEDDELSSLPGNTGRWTGSFEFISATHIASLYLPSQPVWISHPGQIEYSKIPDGSRDISTFRAVPSIDPGRVYQVDASIVNATQAQLKKAGTDYPNWVMERYLVLPENITDRTRQLAADITSTAETPYDKAVAITDYLRKNIKYTEIIEDEFPDDQEIMDWFLFDYKQGFCNYYASAEVVLLRSLGIPARWVVGYAQGETYKDINASGSVEEISFVVRQRNAHAWPEVYFPNIGWVEFEPTASEPEITRIPGMLEDGTGNMPNSDSPDLERLLREMEEEMALLRQDRQLSDPVERPSDNQSQSSSWLILIIGSSIIALLAWQYRHRIRFQPVPILLEKAFIQTGIQPPEAIKHWAFIARLPSLSKAYQEINKALSRIGKKAGAPSTPSERALLLGEFLPEVREAAMDLVSEYEREVFGSQQADLLVATNSARLIRKHSIYSTITKFFNQLKRAPKSLHHTKHDVESQA